MRPGGGKEKGSAFERVVARRFDVWSGVSKNTFWRSTNSGGWVEPGDITPRFRENAKDIIFPFVVECKFYKNIDFFSRQKKPLLTCWWEQVTSSQEQSHSMTPHKKVIRLLILKQNNKPPFAGFCKQDFPPSVSPFLFALLQRTTHYHFIHDRKDVYIMDMEEFLINIPKERFIENE